MHFAAIVLPSFSSVNEAGCVNESGEIEAGCPPPSPSFSPLYPFILKSLNKNKQTENTWEVNEEDLFIFKLQGRTEAIRDLKQVWFI